ncbi:glycosyltransferase [Alphaproteobacteria bacterium LSUCC0684]
MLTVCVVTFNAEHCIEKTLRNLVKNNVVTRIIVKDGLSHDRTPEIVNTFDDSRIEFVSRKDNGIYNAMNQAMNMVKDGSYFVFINADDILINENFDAVNFTGHDVFISPVILSQNGKRIKIHCPDITKINRMNVHHQGFFCRKSAHTPRFNPSLGLLADLAWMREVINFCGLEKVYCADIPLSEATLCGVSDRQPQARIKSRFLYHAYFKSNIFRDVNLYKDITKLIFGQRIKLLVRKIIN